MPPTSRIRPSTLPTHLNKSKPSFISSSRLLKPQNSLPASYYRGGTSRAVIFKREHLDGLFGGGGKGRRELRKGEGREEWKGVFRGVVGSPDENGRQLDGMGGGISSLSKVLVIDRPVHSQDVDITYTFASIGIRNGYVDFSANCGNMLSAVGPYAVDEGLVDINKVLIPNSSEDCEERMAKVRIRNTNTGKVVTSVFPVLCELGGTGRVEAGTRGNERIDGVEGTGARIELAFERPGGSKTGHLLPTGNNIDTIDSIPLTLIDCGNPTIIIPSTSLPKNLIGIPSENHLPTTALLPWIERIRCKAAVAMGICGEDEVVPEGIPKVAVVYGMEDWVGAGGKGVEADFVVRAVSVGQWHGAVPVTVAMSVAVAAGLKGSVVEQVMRNERSGKKGEVVMAHPTGRLAVGTEFDENGEVESVKLFRTARRIMKGEVYWR